MWPYTNSGAFTGKSGYHYLHANSQLGSIQHPHNSHIIPASIWNWIWKLHSIPRIKNFLWRACLDILPLKANLFRRHSAPSAECQICLHPSETTEHAHGRSVLGLLILFPIKSLCRKSRHLMIGSIQCPF